MRDALSLIDQCIAFYLGQDLKYENVLEVLGAVDTAVFEKRDSQKPIIIGRGAEHLVRVKKKLRTPVNRIVGGKAKLDLHVKVAKGWQSDPKQLERLGF